MKTPVGLVAVALTVAILLSLLIVSGTHGENRDPAARIVSPTLR